MQSSQAHGPTSCANGVANPKLSQLQAKANAYVNGSPVHRVATSPNEPPIQRVVMRIANATTGAWEYVSDIDPSQTRYATAELAQAAENALTTPMAPETYGAEQRPPTMFTYADKHPTHVLGSVRQGPHVVGYGAVDQAFDESEKYFSTIFREQVRTPAEVTQHVIDKLGKLKDRPTIAGQIERYFFDYEAVYNRVLVMLADEVTHEEELTSRIKWLMNVDPRSSTNWKTRFSVGKSYRVPKSKIGGKGETTDLSDPVNVDTKSAGGDEARSLWETRKLLLDSEESSGSESS